MTGAGDGGEAGYAAIVLAAGSGSRFGGGKLLAPWRGRPLVEGAVRAALETGASPVIIVTGADAGRVGEACLDAAARVGGAAPPSLVHASDHAEGMGASLRAGIAALPPGLKGVFVFLGDMPDLPGGLSGPLIAALDAGAPAAAPFHKGRRGHPVLFSAGLIPDLARASGDAGAREVLAALGDRLARVATGSPGVLFDVDRPEDLSGGGGSGAA